MRHGVSLFRLAFVLVLLAATGRLLATPQAPPPATLSMADIEEMMGPIALYPDSLLANVLAASVYPDEITAANDFVKGGGDAAGIEQQAWEAPVKSIAKVPEVLNFLTDNIEWTTAVGEVYVTQSQDVMAAVQSLRAKAKASGALQSSEQMTVVESAPASASAPQTIIIEPAQPEVVYVPQYDPQVVYVEDNDSGDALLGGMIGFGVGLAVGEIFDDDDCDWDCDWDDGCVGWGGNDVDIDRDVNIETGDININSGNTVQGGNRERNTNVQGGDKTNVKGGSQTTNVGREGQKWEPNKQKVDQRQAQTGGKRASDQFVGASNKASGARSRVPTKTSAATSRQPSKPLKANNSKPSITPANQVGGGSGAGANNRSGAGGNAGGNAGRDMSKPAPKPATKAPPSRPAPKPNTPSAAPKPRPTTPSAAPKPKSSGGGKAPSGFSPSSGSSKASSRGASSRGGGGGGGGGRGR